jgi:tRNA-Thr(GGU) m(6)t(6)A37 methyltransferase TsaA
MITLQPVAYVSNSRKEISDDNWGDVISEITLTNDLAPDALLGLSDFSHAEIVFYFDKADPEKINKGARHPRGNKEWPMTGIFAQHGKDRPNHIGLCIAAIVKCEGRTLSVKGLDAIDGTPVLDIKPVMKEFLPRGEVKQPEWSTELMKDYW